MAVKLKKEFITHEMGDQQVMVGVEGAGFRGLVRSNKAAAFIVDSLKEETTKEAIAAAMAEKYDAPKAVIEGDVERILAQLRSIGALDE